MAIVEMKRLALLAMREDQEALLTEIQRLGSVQITQVEDAQSAPPGEKATLERADEQLAQLRWTIEKLSPFDKTKKAMFAQPPEIAESESLRVALRREELLAIVVHTEALERQSGELRGTEAKTRAEIAQLTPWLKLDMPVERLAATRDTVQFVGMVQTRTLPALLDSLTGHLAQSQVFDAARDETPVWVIAHRSVAAHVSESLKAVNFAPTQFAMADGTPKSRWDVLQKELSAIADERASIQRTLAELARELPDLKILCDQTNVTRERFASIESFAGTKTTFYLRGWVPAKAVDKLTKRVHKVAPSCVVEVTTPEKEDDPPVLLDNPKWAKPYEAILEGFSLPSPHGIDPTRIMAPFFAFFFGLMLSDAAYGILLVIGIPLVLKLVKAKNVKLPWVIFGGGLFTVLWGALLDTWFGESLKPMLMNPMANPMGMIFMCLGLGVVHLFAGMGMAAYMNIKRGDPVAAICDQGLWVLAITGIAMMFLPATAMVGQWMAIASAVGIIFTAKRSGPFLKRIFGGLASLYNITSWLGDILSYLRLFGLGLATGVVGSVVNLLAGMLMGNVFGIIMSIPVLIVGHGFNLAINALGAYVHSCRLQYIEFFGKFYEDGGQPFAPLKQSAKYVVFRETNAD